MADKSDRTERADRPARAPAATDSWEDKPFVGTFRLEQGKHREGGVTYRPGQAFRSKADLLKQNQAGSVKFTKVEEAGRGRSRSARSVGGGEVEGQGSPVQSAAPGGQVSTGFQETSGSGRFQTREPGDATPTRPPQTIGEKQRAELEARARGEESPEGEDYNVEGLEFFGHSEEQLHDLTVPELRQLAEREEVDLSGASRKDEILDAIKAKAKG